MANNADEVPRDGKKVDKNEFKNAVERCSHVAVKSKLGYYHHFIVTKVKNQMEDSPKGIKIIEYGQWNKVFARVHQTFLPFDDIDFELGVYLIKSEGYPESREEKEEAIQRACSRLGEDNYSAAINNCEHFVTWALTGEPVSDQINKAGPLKKMYADCADPIITSVNWKTACAPFLPIICETMFVGYDIYKLYKGLDMNTIKNKDFQRGVFTTIISSLVGSTAGASLGSTAGESLGSRAGAYLGSRAGAYIGSRVGASLGSSLGACVGQICIPIPGIGGLIGGAIGNVIGAEIGTGMGAGIGGRVGSWIGSALGRLSGKILWSGISGFLVDIIRK